MARNSRSTCRSLVQFLNALPSRWQGIMAIAHRFCFNAGKRRHVGPTKESGIWVPRASDMKSMEKRSGRRTQCHTSGIQSLSFSSQRCGIRLLNPSTIYCDETSRLVVRCVVRDTSRDLYMRCLKFSVLVTRKLEHLSRSDRLLPVYPEERNHL
jgi:hypothetical protein